MKKIPYKISNFKRLIKGNMYYVDKTKYIEILEQKDDLQFFIRSRRFGKSLFLSILDTYYDLKEKDKFDKYFKDLYIHKNKKAMGKMRLKGKGEDIFDIYSSGLNG